MLSRRARPRQRSGGGCRRSAGFYRYCEQERLIDRDPGAHVRRPKQDYESTTLGVDRNELGAFLVQAGLSGGRDHALASLLAFNGLQNSEALGADIERLEHNCGHRTLFIHRKGHKTATIPLAPRTSRALDLSRRHTYRALLLCPWVSWGSIRGCTPSDS